MTRERSSLDSFVIVMVLMSGAAVGTWAWLGQPTTVASARKAVVKAGNQLGLPVPEVIKPSTPTAPASAAVTTPRPSRRIASAERSVVSRAIGRRDPSAPKPARPATDAQSTPAQNPPAVVAQTTPAPALRAVAPPIDPAAYDSSHANITEPVLLTPASHAPLSDELHRGETTEMAIQVLVNEDGKVDGVKATVPPRTLRESLLVTNGLSVAKAWQFRPAVKDGHPVKYRLVMPLSMF